MIYAAFTSGKTGEHLSAVIVDKVKKSLNIQKILLDSHKSKPPKILKSLGASLS